MGSFHTHVPDKLKNANKNIAQFLDVFDGMLKIRKEELDNYVRSFYYPAVSDIRIMRKYIDEWDAEYLETSNRLCVDCLYRNYHGIYSGKGTYKGIKLLLGCLFYISTVPAISDIEFIGGKPLILSDDELFVDWLPDEEAISSEVNATTGEEIWCPTLLGDSWLDCYSTFSVTLGLDYTPTDEYLEFVRSVLVLYLPMVNPDFLTININTILV